MEEYVKFLNMGTIFILCIVGLIVLLLIFLAVLLVLCIRQGVRIHILSLIATILVTSVIIYGLYRFTYVRSLDIKEKSFITYTGHFKIASKGIFYPFAFLEDEKGTIVNLSQDGGLLIDGYYINLVEAGEYYGTVVWAKHSKVVVSGECTRIE